MIRRLGGVLAALVVLLQGAPAVLAPPAAAAEGDAPVEVSITRVQPEVLRPGQDLLVSTTVRNDGATALTEPRVVVHLDRNGFISRSSLDRWRTAGPAAAAGSTVLTVDLPAPLAPGASVPVDLLVPASSLGLRTVATSWGARGLAVEVLDRADPARGRLGLARTFALWFPEQEVTATRVSILIPMTGPQVDPQGSAWVGELEQLTRPGGRLADLLTATGEHPEVTWVVDPWLVATTTAEMPDAAPSPRAGPSARAWGSALVARMTDREVQLLPYDDADVAALAHAGARRLFATAVRRAEDAAAATALPDEARVSLAWPADTLPDLVTAAFVQGGADRAVVIGPGQLPWPDVLTYTPTGRTVVSTASGDVTVLTPDERLSRALVQGRVAVADDAAGQVAPAVAAQDLLAELAVITRERPTNARHLLLTAPRDWSPDVAVVTAQLQALDAAPWVHLQPVSALVGAPDPEVDRGTLPERAVSPPEIGPDEIEAMRSATERRSVLSRIVDQPEALLGDLDQELLAPTSVAWRENPRGRGAVVAASEAATETLRDAVSVEPTSVVNLISTSGGLPIQVTNGLDQAATVRVALRPADARLVADEVVTVTLPAGGQHVVQVPVHAVQSGDVTVVVELRTPAGALIDDSTSFTVRVRAEWESIGSAVIAALLALGLIIGVARTIRRGRTGSRAAPQVDAGPDALSPEAGSERARQDATTEGDRA